MVAIVLKKRLERKEKVIVKTNLKIANVVVINDSQISIKS